MSKLHLKSQNFFSQIYSLVKQIPEGRVATYGQIAKILGTRDARKVGFALHANRDPTVPCHRVVNREGKLAENFGWGGWREQAKRLQKEGIKVVKNKVNLKKYL